MFQAFQGDSSLERRHGSIFMFYAILLFTILNGLLYVAIFRLLAWFSWFFALILGFSIRHSTTRLQPVSRELSSPCSLGSPMRVSWRRFRCFADHALSRRIFGIVNVPRKWYAVVYLILMSVCSVSCFNHRCFFRESALSVISAAWSPAFSLRRGI